MAAEFGWGRAWLGFPRSHRFGKVWVIFLGRVAGDRYRWLIMKFLRVMLWLTIALLGAFAVGVAAFQRGEPVNAIWLVVAGVCTFAVAYRF